MDIIQTYQPWSTPLLHTKLPPEILNNLIQLTDEIAEDDNRESYNEQLAGEIENEWKIEPNRLNDIGFTDYAIQLSWEYFNKVVSNYHIINDEIPQSLVVFKNALDNIEIFSSWFNDQREHEYNPMHNHTGILSGVLYLKIPEYLPSRKTKDTDGSISFIQNETASEGMISNSTISFSPKVGDIFLFSAALKHQVYPFRCRYAKRNNKEIRRSLSFNLARKEDHPFKIRMVAG
jgi:hypothetical protein